MTIKIIDGEAYKADCVNLDKRTGKRVWLVKKLLGGPDDSNNDAFVEALVDCETDDPVIAIRAAIEQGSWA